MTISKLKRDIKRVVASEGATLISMHEGKHLRILVEYEGRRFNVYSAKTPSCWRALRNVKAAVRRGVRDEKDN